jgi:membrane protein
MGKLVRLLNQASQTYSQANGGLVAAALTYYALFSLSPLLVLSISISRWIFGVSGLLDNLLVTLSIYITPEIAETLRTLIEDYLENTGSTFPAIISLGVMLFGGSMIFVQLKTALNQIWGITPRPENNLLYILRRQGLAFGIVLLLGGLMVILTLITPLIDRFRQEWFANISLINQLIPYANILFLVLMFAAIFSLTFKILPDANIAWKYVWLGGSLTAVVFTIGELLLGYYLSRTGFGSVYGAAGSFIVLMFWMYVSAQIVLFGAAFTKTYADLYGHEIQSLE